MSEHVMVVAPHPDDETLGCGGTLFKLKRQRRKLFWTIVTSISETEGFSRQRVQERSREIDKVAGLYRFDGVFQLGLPTTKLDTIPIGEMVDSMRHAIQKAQPTTLFVPNAGDIHSDHRVVFTSVMSCVKTFRSPFVRRVYMYEVISETNCIPSTRLSVFAPNSFSDITGFFDKKIKAMAVYRGEMRKHPFPRSPETIRALATVRGAAAGCRYAEAFCQLLDIW